MTSILGGVYSMTSERVWSKVQRGPPHWGHSRSRSLSGIGISWLCMGMRGHAPIQGQLQKTNDPIK